MENYDQMISALTPKQREAVEVIDGPLLVIAGPGTGKTQLLSMRVAHILKKTDANASNILCLTFTNKAAANMRSRLQRLAGPESLQVTVKTFHGFAAEIMAEYPDYFWNGAKLTTAADAVQTDIIQSILSSLPLDNPLAIKFAGLFTSTPRVKNGLKLAKEAGLTPGKLRAMIEVNLAYIDHIEDQLVEILDRPLSYKRLDDVREQIQSLPDQGIDESVKPLLSLSTVIKESLAEAIAADIGTNKTKNTGEWKKRFIQNENKVKGMHTQRRANQWWLHLSDVYEKYRDELHLRGCYDYADMLVEVIAQTRNHPPLLSELQERYQYVMVDEFQDSNAAQMTLAHLISSNPVTEGKPNLMVVGDDDQSIYKFNGAELSNMLGFRRTYKSTRTIVLEDNFRSSQVVLDASRQVIELASERLAGRESDITKDLIARKEPQSSGILRHDSYPSMEHQYYGVVGDIVKSFNSDKESSIAVIARNHSSLSKIAAELHRKNIPVRYERQRNILEHEAVEQLIMLCEIIQGIIEGDKETVNERLTLVLGHQVWQIDPVKLWQLAVENRYSARWLESMLEHEDSQISSFANWLIHLSSEARSQKLPIIIDHLLGLRESKIFENPFKTHFIDINLQSETYIEALSAVQRLRDTVTEFAVSREPTLKDFVDHIELHRQNGIGISDESVFVSSPEAVHLLTAHKAKGLEYDQVYIIDAIEKQWQPSKRATSTPANLPLQPYGDDMDDYVRLMYVAFTRARHTIIASSYRSGANGEEVVSSGLITQALPLNVIEHGKAPNPVDVLEASVRWPSLQTSDERLALSDILEDYSLNVTGLLNFLDVSRGGPRLFLERNLLRLPGARTISLAYGTAIHSALEQAQRRINTGDFDIDFIQSYFEKELKKEPILSSELDRWLPKGRELMRNLFEEQILVLPEGGMPEQRLQGIDIDGAIIDGKLDHIITDTHDVLISDYKTGPPLRSFDSRAKSLQIKIWKHRTQLVFYALLARHHPLYANKQATGRMLYIEAEQAPDVPRTLTPSTEEIDRLAAICRVVYRRVKDYNLPDTTSYSPDYEGIVQFENDLINGLV